MLWGEFKLSSGGIPTGIYWDNSKSTNSCSGSCRLPQHYGISTSLHTSRLGPKLRDNRLPTCFTGRPLAKLRLLILLGCFNLLIGAALEQMTRFIAAPAHHDRHQFGIIAVYPWSTSIHLLSIFRNRSWSFPENCTGLISNFHGMLLIGRTA